MRTFRSIAAASGLAGCAVAIGNFDGVHLGHQALFALALRLARARGKPAVALTFEPHPARVLRPELAPRLLTPLPQKLAMIERAGLDAVVVQPFDRAFAKSSAGEFVARDLAGSLGAADVVIGRDFTAGHDRAGPDALRPVLAEKGIALHLVPQVAAQGVAVSSTKIREFLLEGNVAAAAMLLGRPYLVPGVVGRGAGRGRGIGFATANVDPGPEGEGAMLPAPGVYAVGAVLTRPDGSGKPRCFDGVCNVGVKPTVSTGGPVTAEVHLLDYPGGDLYGEPIEVTFLERLRDEQRFPGIDALKAQIARDVDRARALFAVKRNGPA